MNTSNIRANLNRLLELHNSKDSAMKKNETKWKRQNFLFPWQKQVLSRHAEEKAIILYLLSEIKE